jgi:acetolactate synthase-1/2/3 large subunit
MTTSVSGADRIAKRLAEAGCRHAFGIPGGEVLALVDALDRAGIRVVTTRHETAAGIMAEGTFQADGAPGVLVVTIGPGVANSVNAIVNALQERVPLVVLAGCLDGAETATYTHQIFDQRALLAPITKASITVATGAVEVAIDRALAIATSDPPGPVHLDVPISVQRAASSEGDRARTAALPRACCAPAVTDRLRELVAKAERPLVIAGVDAMFQRAERAVGRFVEISGAPIVTTYKAKGIVDEHASSSLGAAGLSPRADAILLPLVRDADVVVLAGYDPIEMRRGWHAPFGDRARVIDLCAAAPLHGMHHATDVLVGDVGAHLAAIEARTSATSAWRERIEGARASLAAAFAPETDGLGPLGIARALEESAPRDAVITVDVGAHRIALAQAFRARTPRSMLQSAAFCTMGVAVPLAIGRKLAEPARPVIAVVGDGGMDMTLGELATARDLGLGVVVVVIDDASLALIELKQRAEGRKNVGVDSGRTRYAAIAEAMGCIGVVATSAAEVQAAIRDGLARPSTPTVVHVPIARHAYDGKI